MSKLSGHDEATPAPPLYRWPVTLSVLMLSVALSLAYLAYAYLLRGDEAAARQACTGLAVTDLDERLADVEPVVSLIRKVAAVGEDAPVGQRRILSTSVSAR